jgi:hypothetical protein
MGIDWDMNPFPRTKIYRAGFPARLGQKNTGPAKKYIVAGP